MKHLKDDTTIILSGAILQEAQAIYVDMLRMWRAEHCLLTQLYYLLPLPVLELLYDHNPKSDTDSL